MSKRSSPVPFKYSLFIRTNNSLVDKRLKIYQSIVNCNRLAISKTEKTVENYAGVLASCCIEVRKTFRDWSQHATKELEEIVIKHLDARKTNLKMQHDNLWNRWLQTKKELETKRQNQLSKMRKNIVELSSKT